MSGSNFLYDNGLPGLSESTFNLLSAVFKSMMSSGDKSSVISFGVLLRTGCQLSDPNICVDLKCL